MVKTALLLAALAPLAPWAQAGTRVTVDGLDPRIELGEIAAWLQEKPPLSKIITPATESYVEDVRRHFAAFTRHPAVTGSVPFTAPRISSEWQAFKRRSRILLGRAPVADKEAAGWDETLRAFERDTDFSRFFAAAAKRYDPALDKFRQRLAGLDYVGMIETYTGMPLDAEVRIIFTPMMEARQPQSGETAHLRESGERVIHNIFSTLLLDNLGGKGLPEDVPHRLWHEAGHVYLDPLYLKNRELIDKRRPSGLSPEEWPDYIQDLIAQAVVVRLFTAHMGEQEGARQLAYEDEEDAARLKPLLASLRRYEKKRKRYETLEKFYPELIRALR
ncbi:MAG: DUF4932 domain-containing protein [Elusimicrobiota bacterium]